jgi:hypothetical protein
MGHFRRVDLMSVLVMYDHYGIAKFVPKVIKIEALLQNKQ